MYSQKKQKECTVIANHMKILFLTNRIRKVCILLCVLFVCFFIYESCGIYAVTDPLNPPYGQQRDGNNYLRFSGNNEESYFEGYVLWYKGKTDIDYHVCEYEGKAVKPTIIPTQPEDTYTVFFKDLGPQIQIDNFDNFKAILDYDLENYYGFQFAVSSYGIKDGKVCESEKVLF